MANNYSYKVTKTRLFKEKERLGLEFIYETSEAAFFGLQYEKEVYWLIEVFNTKEILVSDKEGSIFDKSERFLNLLRLDI